VTIRAACAGVWVENGVCAPDPCPPPANDQPVNAIPLSLGVGVSGVDCNATDLNDGPPASCQNDAHKGVWYTFTAPATAAFTLSTCGSFQDTVLALFDAALTGEIACNDDGCDGLAPPGSGFEAVVNGVVLIQGATYLTRVSTYGSDPAGGMYMVVVTATHPLGACCLPGGACSLSDAARCVADFTEGGVCTPSPCPLPPGACCRGSICTLAPAQDCSGPGNSFGGSGTVCNIPGNSTTPCCLADFNHDGSVAVQDIFDFLAAYFMNDPWADQNASGVVGVQDIFDFITAYFAGCP
jgi:hypothetical protein